MSTTEHPQNTDPTPSVTDVQGFDRGTGTGEPTESVAHLLRLMKGADDAFNRRDYDDFLDHGHHEDVVVNYIGRPTTVGRAPHRADMEAIIAIFPDLRVHNDPYDIQFGQGEWTVAIGRMSGTFTRPMTLPDGTVIEPTNKSFMTFFTTIARWQNEQMLTEYVLWDDQDVMTQIGVAG
ncbi:ester cyclase [Kribbella sp. NPDC050124]|uniref:ester cyclase n=1 Tax=Kribbella sp. NPDC050124 TaxID=3364114 RepID=UPI0037972CC6